MFSLIKLMIKLVILIIILIVVSQLEYRGRKVETYVKEFFYAYGLDKIVDKVQNVFSDKNIEKIKDTFDSSKLKEAMEKIKEEERKELQKLLDKN